jgi:serine protease
MQHLRRVVRETSDGRSRFRYGALSVGSSSVWTVLYFTAVGIGEPQPCPSLAMTETRVAHLVVRHAALAAVALGAWLVVGRTPARAAAYVPHEVIVGYRATAPRRPTPQNPIAAEASADPGPWKLGRIGPRAATAPVVPRRGVHLPRHVSVASALRRLRARADVAYADPDYVAHAAGGFYPDDHGRSGAPQGWERLQWNMLPGTGVDAPQAWANLLADHRAGGRGVRIAVLDTGVAYRNWHAFRESPDLRDTRFIDPYDFIAHNRYPLDRDGHGTFVASVIAESTNNTIGLTGLAYGATIMPMRVLSAAGEGDESTIAQGILYAVAHHAQIINLSLEFLPSQVRSARAIPEIVSAIRDARRHGVMVVAAGGNDQTRELAYPARLPGVVSVGATTRDGCVANYSNDGADLDLVAPGGGSDAIMPGDPACDPARNLPSIYQMTLSDPPHWGQFGYPGYYVGTSMSAPEVAGAAALVIASGVIGRDPTPDQVLTRLEQTATPLPAAGVQPNPTYGWGLLNAGAATSPLAVTAPIHH